MLRTMNFHLRDTFRARGEAQEELARPPPAAAEVDDDEEVELPDIPEEEVEVMRVRLMRDHWIRYLGASRPHPARSTATRSYSSLFPIPCIMEEVVSRPPLPV